MIGPSAVTGLMLIAGRAIEMHAAETQRKAAHDGLTRAYVDWKDRNCLERVERDTLEWVRMMSATRKEYEAFESAKRKERNARRRLASAIDRFEREEWGINGAAA